MKLEYKLTSLIIFIVLAIVSTASIFSFRVIQSNVSESVGARLLDTSKVVASIPLIQETLADNNISSLRVQNFIEDLRLKTKVLFIVVMDMDGIKYSHPIPSYVGCRFTGFDHNRVLYTGQSYVSEGMGTLGYSIRAFSPVMDEGVQVGAVAVGVLKGDISDEVQKYTKDIFPYIIVTLILGVIAARIIAMGIKKAIFGLEPKEIAFLLSEKESIINNMHDGLIVVNIDGEVRLINNSAKEILKINNSSEVAPQIIDQLMEIIYRRTRVFNKEIRLHNNVIMANFYTLVGEDGTVHGGIASIQDFTVVNNMAEELTGVKELLWNLRAQNHEFMNKLHTISGLIQLEESDKALEYIYKTTERRGLITESLKGIKDASIQGLIFSKYNRADEAKIKFEIDDECVFYNHKGVIIQDLLVIIGNLLENSIEEVKGKNNSCIFFGIYETDKIRIIVQNNGRTIKEDISNLFKRGFSSKGDLRGMGLYNIKTIVDDLGGEIILKSNERTTWEIII